jgi:hypothetical protein
MFAAIPYSLLEAGLPAPAIQAVANLASWFQSGFAPGSIEVQGEAASRSIG